MSLNLIKRITNNRFKLKFIHKRHRSKHRETYKRLDEILEQFHANCGLVNNAQYYKLFELERLLKKHKPNSIIEFGTGSTTPIFVDYARKNDSSLICVDESKHWLENSMKLSGVNDREKNIHFISAPKKVDKEMKPIEISYDFTLETPVDFVLIDGPSLDVDGVTRRDAINADIFSLFELRPPTTILVDVRVSTVKAIRDRLSTHYHCDISDLQIRNLHDNYNYFSVFRLKQQWANRHVIEKMA